jgi:small conductance mechanosensitive channel
MLRYHFLNILHPGLRILFIIVISIAAHFIVRLIRKFTQWILARKIDAGAMPSDSFIRRFPKIATLITILVSTVTFLIYFAAIGLILKEFGISLTAYFASATVIGLAIGFGSQGLVQDVVIGMTLIFSNVFNIEDIVEISGQVGRVESIGLRFTELVNLHGQKIYIPNRTIGVIGRFRRGYVRAYVDVQVPEAADQSIILETVTSMARGMRSQHRSIILESPDIFTLKEATPGDWCFLRVKFHLWPGQGELIENTFKPKVIAAMKRFAPEYPDWMVTVTYKAE